jgi:hypothetical protein
VLQTDRRLPQHDGLCPFGQKSLCFVPEYGGDSNDEHSLRNLDDDSTHTASRSGRKCQFRSHWEIGLVTAYCREPLHRSSKQTVRLPALVLLSRAAINGYEEDHDFRIALRHASYVRRKGVGECRRGVVLYWPKWKSSWGGRPNLAVGVDRVLGQPACQDVVSNQPPTAQNQWPYTCRPQDQTNVWPYRVKWRLGQNSQRLHKCRPRTLWFQPAPCVSLLGRRQARGEGIFSASWPFSFTLRQPPLRFYTYCNHTGNLLCRQGLRCSNSTPAWGWHSPVDGCHRMPRS